MFGFFKSKEDKEIDRNTKTLRTTREPIFYDGNAVVDLATDIMNRYKLTVSTIEGVGYPGLLTPDIEDSGYIVIAINKREAIYVNYQQDYKDTVVKMVSSAQSLLDNIKKGLAHYSNEAQKGHGMVYKKLHWINIVGAVTCLGHEVGIQEADEGLYLPSNYKDNKFYIVDYDDKVWIVFDEKRKKEDMTYGGQDKRKHNQSNEDNFWESIKKLDESDESSIRLNFKNIGEAANAMENMEIEQVTIDYIKYINVDDKVYGIYVVDETYIHLTDFSDIEELIDFQALVDKVNIRNEKILKVIEANKNNDYGLK